MLQRNRPDGRDALKSGAIDNPLVIENYRYTIRFHRDLEAIPFTQGIVRVVRRDTRPTNIRGGVWYPFGSR
jgi:hypothetical protein